MHAESRTKEAKGESYKVLKQNLQIAIKSLYGNNCSATRTEKVGEKYASKTRIWNPYYRICASVFYHKFVVTSLGNEVDLSMHGRCLQRMTCL